MKKDLFSLKGKTALVTGGNTGLGLAMAEGLATQGADLVIVGRNEKTLKKAQTRLLKQGHLVYTHCFDLHDLNALPHFFEIILKVTKTVDILINNAGIINRQPACSIAMDKWYEMFNLNVSSMLKMSQIFANEKIKIKKPGKIINIGSVLAERARPETTAYAVTKSAVQQLTRSLAHEWGAYGINVNTLSPGYFKTEMTKDLVENEEFSTFVKDRCAMGRWGNPEELVGTAVFLASAASDFVTGQTIQVDGGWLTGL